MSFREKFAFGYQIFGLIVVLLMIALGAFLLLGNYFNYIPRNVRIAFALLLLSVGAFRIVNLWLRYRRKKDEKDDNR
jgi:divalent metal cation (Fe/Co/Zn/Cd) transporter